MNDQGEKFKCRACKAVWILWRGQHPPWRWINLPEKCPYCRLENAGLVDRLDEVEVPPGCLYVSDDLDNVERPLMRRLWLLLCHNLTAGLWLTFRGPKVE